MPKYLPQLLAVQEELPTGVAHRFGMKLRQHIYVVARRIEILSQDRSEKPQSADAARPAKLGYLVLVDADG